MKLKVTEAVTLCRHCGFAIVYVQRTSDPRDPVWLAPDGPVANMSYCPGGANYAVDPARHQPIKPNDLTDLDDVRRWLEERP